ncbi:MAG: efflux RND transporter periplasmic adaptor subunit [Phycisphaerales bacterium]|nr:efflux RND transporter periplasmic adaptor subunit [Phycisphaerales bacterium]
MNYDPTPPSPSDRPAHPPRVVRWIVALFRIVIPLAVIALGAYGAMILLARRPEPTRNQIESVATLVETIVPTPGDDVAEIIAYGTVEPSRVLTLQTQVGGLVVGLNEALQPGGIVKSGERLLTIDDRDYQLLVRQREADVATASVALQLEDARRLVAEREWELLGDSVETSDVGRELARRGPQRLEKEAMLLAAKSRLDLAQLDLERTVISAPFNGLVREDDVEIGQIVTPQARIASIVGTDRFDVMVAIPLDKLEWLRIDSANPGGNSVAKVILELGDGRRIERTGRVDRLLGEVERAGRLARVRILVEDPLGLTTGPNESAEPLLLGSYVRVEIAGPVVSDVIELPRSVIRNNQNVWVMDAGSTLRFRKLNAIVGRPDTVLANVALEPGDEIITSPLPAAIPGMPLERLDAAGLAGDSAEVVIGETNDGKTPR